VDTTWYGQFRKLLVQANRNGVLYVLDRTNGKMLLAGPLIKKLTWAKEILPDGRPVMNPNQTPTIAGNLICPAVEGAGNFFSTSYNPNHWAVLCQYSRKMRKTAEVSTSV
jgi:alcohol dehydrogenase (cytochrome c)